jgi:hypothetical protein
VKDRKRSEKRVLEKLISEVIDTDTHSIRFVLHYGAKGITINGLIISPTTKIPLRPPEKNREKQHSK